MAWAVGGSDFCAPEGIAFEIQPSAPHFLLEIHYDNPNGRTGIQDTSGMKLHFVPRAGSGSARPPHLTATKKCDRRRETKYVTQQYLANEAQKCGSRL